MNIKYISLFSLLFITNATHTKITLPTKTKTSDKQLFLMCASAQKLDKKNRLLEKQPDLPPRDSRRDVDDDNPGRPPKEGPWRPCD